MWTQVIAMLSREMSPDQSFPRTPSNTNEAVSTSADAVFQELPCVPLLDQTTAPLSLFSRSVPTAKPYMWYHQLSCTISPRGQVNPSSNTSPSRRGELASVYM